MQNGRFSTKIVLAYFLLQVRSTAVVRVEPCGSTQSACILHRSEHMRTLAYTLYGYGCVCKVVRNVRYRTVPYDVVR